MEKISVDLLDAEPDLDFLYAGDTSLPFSPSISEASPPAEAPLETSRSETGAPNDTQSLLPQPSKREIKRKNKPTKQPVPAPQAVSHQKRRRDPVPLVPVFYLTSENRFHRWLRADVIPATRAIYHALVSPVIRLSYGIYTLALPALRLVGSGIRSVAHHTYSALCIGTRVTYKALNRILFRPLSLSLQFLWHYALVSLRFLWHYLFVVALYFLFVTAPRRLAAKVLYRGLHCREFSLDILPSKEIRVRVAETEADFGLRDGQKYEIYLANRSGQACYCFLEIDGVEMGKFLLQPFSSHFVQRPVNQEAQFTFVKNNAALPRGQIDDGSVVVAKFFGLPRAPVADDQKKIETEAKPVEPERATYVSGSTILSGHSDQPMSVTHIPSNYVPAMPSVVLTAHLIAL